MPRGETYHVEFKHEGKWRPAYATYYGKEAAEKGRKAAMQDIEYDTGKKEKSSDWRIAPGPGAGSSFSGIAWDQWFSIGALGVLAYLIFWRKD